MGSLALPGVSCVTAGGFLALAEAALSSSSRDDSDSARLTGPAGARSSGSASRWTRAAVTHGTSPVPRLGPRGVLEHSPVHQDRPWGGEPRLAVPSMPVSRVQNLMAILMDGFNESVHDTVSWCGLLHLWHRVGTQEVLIWGHLGLGFHCIICHLCISSLWSLSSQGRERREETGQPAEFLLRPLPPAPSLP